MELQYPHRIVRAIRRDELKKAIEIDHTSGRLSDIVFRSYRRIFSCPRPRIESSSWAQSIIIATVPQPYSYVVFEWNHKPHQLLIPPSYIRYWEATERAESELNALIGTRGALVGFARLPQKLLAARSGLARYGKNNIAYVPEFGSHHMLVSFYSSLPCVEETWTEPLMLESCRR